MFLTQPAISKRIATLEATLDTRLFDRIGKQVRLTEAGRALLPHTRRILLELDESRRVLSHMSDHTSGQLALGISHHIGLHRLPSVLRDYTLQYPGVTLDLNFMESEMTLQQVQSGQIEMAIITLPDTVDAPLHSETIWDDPMCCVVAFDHPLASGNHTTVQQLCQTPAILQARNTNTRLQVDRAFEKYLPFNILMETGYLETIKSMVSTGLGWSVLPQSLIDEQLIKLNVKGINISRKLGVVTNSSLTLSKPAVSMLKTLRQLPNK